MKSSINIIKETSTVEVTKPSFTKYEHELMFCLGVKVDNDGTTAILNARFLSKDAMWTLISTFYPSLKNPDVKVGAKAAEFFVSLSNLYAYEYSLVNKLIQTKLDIKTNSLRPSMHGKKISELLMKHQVEGVFNGIRKKHNFISFQQGLGKTITAAAISICLDIQRTLVLCPSVCKLNWYEEFYEWGINTDYITVIDSKRSIIAKKQELFVFCNFEMLNEKTVKKLIDYSPQHIILDEAHRLKDITTRNFKSVKKIYSVLPEEPKVTFLSGTPMKNTAEDMFAYLNLSNHLLGRKKEAFLNRFTVREQTKYGKKIVESKNLYELQSLISNFVLRKVRAKCLDLPGKILHKYHFDIEDYQEEYNNAIAELKKTKSFDSGSNRLAAKRLMIILTKAKVNEIIDLANRIIENGEKVVIATEFKEPMDMLLKHFNQEGKPIRAVTIRGGMDSFEKKAAEKAFRTNPNIDVIVLQTIAGGIGINLVESSNIILGNLPDTYADLEQVEDRLDRIGQVKPVNVYYTICRGKNSLDVRVFERVERKLFESSIVMDKKERTLSNDVLDSSKSMIDDLMNDIFKNYKD